MKKTKTFDAVQIMRKARDKVLEDTREMSSKELISYYRKSSRKVIKDLGLKKIEK